MHSLAVCARNATALAGPGTWRSTRVAVEFHAHTKAFFWGVVAPHRDRLQSAYAAVGGRVLSVLEELPERADSFLVVARMDG